MAVSYPVGVQHFSEIIQNKAVYVDKTAFIYELIRQGSPKPYFLSRPRRFGKSLLISTFQEIFSGNKDLFKGLYIYDKIELQKFPIIHISFVLINIENLGLEQALIAHLISIAKQEGIEIWNETAKFSSLQTLKHSFSTTKLKNNDVKMLEITIIASLACMCRAGKNARRQWFRGGKPILWAQSF